MGVAHKHLAHSALTAGRVTASVIKSGLYSLLSTVAHCSEQLSLLTSLNLCVQAGPVFGSNHFWSFIRKMMVSQHISQLCLSIGPMLDQHRGDPRCDITFQSSIIIWHHLTLASDVFVIALNSNFERLDYWTQTSNHTFITAPQDSTLCLSKLSDDSKPQICHKWTTTSHKSRLK